MLFFETFKKGTLKHQRRHVDVVSYALYVIFYTKQVDNYLICQRVKNKHAT